MDFSLLLSFISQSPALFFTYIFILGCMVGSFLNVVIYRLPVMMEKEWACDCRELLKDELKPNKSSTDNSRFNLAYPPSRCPHCDHKIKPWENIPIISWLLLKGKCSSCQTTISIRYPLIELLTGIISLIVAVELYTPAVDNIFLLKLIGYLVLSWGLIALTFIDIDKMYIPDNITYPLLWFGLILSIWHLQVSPQEAIIGASVGYLSLWSVFWTFKLITGKEGMGYGDFKLLAVFGAWLGWQSIPLIVLLSSSIGALFGIIIIIRQKQGKDTPIPFGPYLALAGFIALLWGNDIITLYLSTMV